MRIGFDLKNFPELNAMPKTGIIALIEHAVREFIKTPDGKAYCKIIGKSNNNTEKKSEKNNG